MKIYPGGARRQIGDNDQIPKGVGIAIHIIARRLYGLHINANDTLLNLQILEQAQ
jgi:hypothetical protein